MKSSLSGGGAVAVGSAVPVYPVVMPYNLSLELSNSLAVITIIAVDCHLPA